ncbi:MAG: hypothetical protein V4558_02455 [Gemmatimonadota bacterium]
MTIDACAIPQPSACAIPTPVSCAIPEPAACTYAPEPPLRWEWRTFDFQPERWARLLRQVELTPATAPSHETYLLTPRSPDNVKIREGRVEVKRLLRTSPAGLELWRPALKAEFPLDPDTVLALCHAWRCEQPETIPTIATPDALITWVTRALPEVRVIPIRKIRRRFRLGACEGESVTLDSGNARLESLALEHHDPAVLNEALAELQLSGARNINYVAGLKRFLGWSLDAAHCVPAMPV